MLCPLIISHSWKIKGDSGRRVVSWYSTLDQTKSLTKPCDLKASAPPNKLLCLRENIFCLIFCLLGSFSTGFLPTLCNLTRRKPYSATYNGEISIPLNMSTDKKHYSLHWYNLKNMLVDTILINAFFLCYSFFFHLQLFNLTLCSTKILWL